MKQCEARPMIWTPLAILAVVSIVSWLVPIDVELSQQFYAGDRQWPIGEEPFWKFLHAYGPIPGIALSAVALFALIGGFFMRKLRAWRLPSVFLIVAILLGPVVVVNFIFKDHYGRPRPSQTLEFDGGAREYLPVLVPGKEKGGSFPSGHSSIGFFLFTPYFIFLGWRKRWAYAFLYGGLVYGVLMGAARVLQGGHYLTDVIWAAGMVYLVDYALYYALRLYQWTPGGMANEDPRCS